MTDMTTPSLHERALGAYLGFAVGDALGATVEFMIRREIETTYQRHETIVGGGWLRLAPGQVTDDTEMTMCLGRAILEGETWDVARVCEQFATWLRGHPVDVGNTCRRGIRRYISDGSVSGPFNEGDAGNGALMRNLPVVLATLADEAALALDHRAEPCDPSSPALRRGGSGARADDPCAACGRRRGRGS